MPARLQSLLRLQVPVIVRLAERRMPVDEVLALAPGTIVEFPKCAEDELEILINDRRIGLGRAVKVGENFGIRVTRVGDVRECLRAVSDSEPEEEEESR